jgi:glycosyltransferase involved in cell wall biosynthesis
MPLRHYHSTYLRKAVDSIIGQMCPYWSLLVIVDVENVSTFKDLLRRDLMDSRISMLENEGRQLGGKLNTGMRHARTGFVAILLGDDMWSPDAVAVLSEYIPKFPGVDLFHSSRIFIYWRRGDLTFGGWLRSLTGPREFRDWAADDPRPFLSELRILLRSLSRGLLRKLRGI